MTVAGEGRGRTFIEEARRRQIVQATIEVVAEHGHSGATFARIAARAGISPSLISYHFTTKSALMDRVVADITADMDAAVTAEIGDAPGYRTALRRLIEAQVRYFAEHTISVLALGRLADGGDPAITARLTDHRHRTIGELEGHFAEGQADGELGPFPTRAMAVTLLAALEAVPAELSGERATDPDVYGRALADLFDAGVTPR